jgi:hypothetical protein
VHNAGRQHSTPDPLQVQCARSLGLGARQRWDQDLRKHPPRRSQMRQDSRLSKGANGRGAVSSTFDTVLRPNIFQVSDQNNQLLRGAFLKHTHKLHVGRRPGGLTGTELRFDVDKLRLVLVLCRKDFREQWRHRPEWRWLEHSSMAGEAGLLDREPHLLSNRF